jgi:beta-lactamase superfamily II metal-dependent hydrolase
VLWVNDAGFVAEHDMLGRWLKADLRADVILRNQHSTDYSMLPEFLSAVQPRCIINSHARDDIAEWLKPPLALYCERNEIPLIDQVEAGMVQMRFYSDRLELKPWLRGDTINLSPRLGEPGDVKSTR